MYLKGTAGRGQQNPEQDSRCEELGAGGDAARPVPAAYAVAREQLATAGPWKTQHVLEIGRGAGSGAERDLVEEPTAKGERDDRRDPRPQLKAAVREVLVRHPIAGEVCQRAECESPASRGGEPSRGAAGGDVK